MSNTKKINPKTGKRVAELIKSLNMTQAEFGDKLGLGSRQISCIVTGKRRLTEDNARRISKLFPQVRFEWLLGWDDYPDNNSFLEAKLRKETYEISKDEIEFCKREFIAGQILTSLGYQFHTTYSLEDRRKEKNDAGENKGYNTKSTSKPLFSVPIEDIYDAFIEREREITSEWKSTGKDNYINNQRWFLCDANENICLEVSGETYERFFNELYDIVNALLMYHFPNLKEITNAKED